jgi:chromosome segregation ATPase
MEASTGNEPRVIRLADAPDAIKLDTDDLLGRLEAQAEENGRVQAKAESFERVAKAERDARRRLSDRLKTERRAAEDIHARAEVAETRVAAQAEEIERLSGALSMAQQQAQLTWTQLSEADRQLALAARPLWRKLLRRAPKD